ncbi:MAG: flippase-like domain-containing protein [Candidatus Nanopelagicales bacterium]|nr:flippase-like domain-containing protein [Candidatus Nanopelagicales bacterium]MCF8551564.1 flippase-like domain-containing protein [Candidatus Nanopelagicales bacterium]
MAEKSSLRRNLISAVVGLVVMVLLFWFISQNAGEYTKAFAELGSIDTIWRVGIVIASLVNIAIYPLTAIAAIHSLSYLHASLSRQAGFTLSNIVPGGGAVAVATQYAVLARYGVPQARAAAAVSADAIYTYLFTLGAPSIAVLLLVLEGRSTAAFMTTALIGLAAVIISLIVIIAVLRSEESARKIGSWLQRPVNKVFHLIHKAAPDIAAMLSQFHNQASDLIRTRWKSLTITNVSAQMAPMLVLWAALMGLGVTESQLSIIELFAAYSVALVLTAFPITPGGLGTVDAALIALLVAFGVESSTAVAADLLWRLGWFLPQLLVGAVALIKYWWDGRRIRARAAT